MLAKMRIIIPFAFLAIATAARLPARGQISVEEAEQRLKARTASRPTTQPTSELDKLREENLRLRERILDLQQEVTTLKEALARASVPSGPASAPAAAETEAQKALVGRWRGGDITAGAGYLLEFAPDGTYKQTFLASPQSDAGQYRLTDAGLLEMWSDKSAENRKHNQYRISVTPTTLTLTPIIVDGVEVKLPRAMTLRRAE